MTTQDLAPFEALERSRAEFLELLSHELRAPLASDPGLGSDGAGGPRARRTATSFGSTFTSWRSRPGALARVCCRWTRHRQSSQTSSSGRGRRSRTAAEFVAVALHRPSRRENIGGLLRAADGYGVELVVLGGGAVPPEPLGHPTDTTQAWLRIPVSMAA